MTAIPRAVGETTGDHYTLDRVIGSGAEAVVYLARRDAPGRAGEPVCVKLYRAPKPEDFDKVRVLVHLLRGFKHVARLREVALDPRTRQPVGVVTDYCPDAETLRAFVDRGGTRGLTTLHKATLCRQAAVAVGQFTTSPYVRHNDLGPQNLLLVPDGHALALVVIDNDSCWALRCRKPTGSVTDYLGPFGTPGHRAPEQLRSPALLPSPESMHWSLAVAIFMILYGEHPCALRVTPETQGVQEEDLVADGHYPFLCRPHPTYVAPRYDTNASDVPPAFERLFRDALAGPAGHRPTAKEWADAFDAWIAGPLAPERSSRARAALAWLRARWFRPALVAAAGGLVALLAVAARPHAGGPPAVPPTPFWTPSLREYFTK